MIKKMLLFSFFGILAGLVSCASQYPLLAQQATVKAQELRKYCVLQGLSSKTFTRADSLYTLAKQYSESGKDEESYYSLEMAAIYYKLALSQKELADSKEEIQKLEQTLVKVRDKLDTYKQVLSEIESKNK